MFQITEQQIENRWNVLPMRLLEILCSFDTAKMILEICKKNHVMGEKSDKISGLTGFVAMGFIHPEDLAKEIKEATGIHSEIIDLIVKEIDRKIFAPIRSEIDKAYALPLESEKPEEETQAPEIEESVVTDIRRETGGVKITKEVRYAQPAEVEPMRIVGVGEEEKLIVPKAEEKGFEDIDKVSEFESLKGSAVAEAMADKPVVLHEEEGLQTVLGETKKKSLGELFGFLNGKEAAVRKESAPVIGEVGYGDKEEPESLEKESEERVVHYDVGLITPLVEAQTNTDLTQTDTDKTEEVKKTESKPRLFFKNILQAIKPTIKVVDFTEVEEEKKDIPLISDGEPKEFLTTIDSSKENLKEEPLMMVEAETVKKEELVSEIKPEIKESFFKKLFKLKKDKKEEQAVVEETPEEILPKEEEIKDDDKVLEGESLKEDESLKKEKKGFFKSLLESLKALKFKSFKKDESLKKEESLNDDKKV